jgi:cytoskeleton protein RodZ
VATRQHLSGTAADAAPLDMPVKTGTTTPPGPTQRKTVMASLAPVSASTEAMDVAPVADITVRVRAETWLEATAADGSNIEKGLLPAGSERRYGAAQLARLTIGNAAAVDVQNRGSSVDLAPFTRTNVARFTVSSDGSLVAVD